MEEKFVHFPWPVNQRNEGLNAEASPIAPLTNKSQNLLWITTDNPSGSKTREMKTKINQHVMKNLPKNKDIKRRKTSRKSSDANTKLISPAPKLSLNHKVVFEQLSWQHCQN